MKDLNLNIGNELSNNVSVAINSASNGALVYAKQFGSQSGVLTLDLTGLGRGVYALHLTMNNVEKVFKILRQ